ncbi:tRNA lysidine(34) synthetase TilS [Pseudomonadota bacterium]
MANASTSGFTSKSLIQTLSFLPKGASLWVGYSGGCDSHVLLHALASLRQALSIQLQAVYVNHGLSINAHAWGEHCQNVCDELNVPLRILQVDAKPKSGQSPEESARFARYHAIAELLGHGEYLCTAHHQDDQAETLILQLLRGAGPKGLASMPLQSALGDAWQIRPLLNFSRQQLENYGEQHSLQWINDESNQDTGFDRNFLRHELMPILKKRWPSAARTLSRSASHSAEAAELLDELAKRDYEQAKGESEDRLKIGCLTELSVSRLKNLLRYWIALNGLPLPSDIKLQHVMGDVIPAAQDKMPCVKWRGAEVRRFDGCLYAMPPMPSIDPCTVIPWNDLDSVLELPDGRKLRLVGQKAEVLIQGGVSVRFRQGGEQIIPAGNKHHKNLKQLFQEHRVPSWERERVPLLFVGEELVVVVGVCFSERLVREFYADTRLVLS